MVPRWQQGQRVVLDDREIVTIDRVTSGGLACIGLRKFNVYGMVRGRSGSPWTGPSRIKELTPEFEARLEGAEATKEISAKLAMALADVERWRQMTERGRMFLDPADITRAERLIAAIYGALNAPTSEMQ